MKTDNEQKTAFQGLMKLLKENIPMFDAAGQAKGKLASAQKELAKLQAVVTEKTDDVLSQKIEAARTVVTAREVESNKLYSAAKTHRKTFDDRLSSLIGDMSKNEGKTMAKDWGFYVQKAYVFGFADEKAFRYVDPRTAETLKQIGVTYVQAHNALGKKVLHGVNPASVQELDKELSMAIEATRKEALDMDKLERLQVAQANLRKHCDYLLKMKVVKPTGSNRSAAVQHRQASLIENESVTLGQTAGTAPLPEKKPRFTSARK